MKIYSLLFAQVFVRENCKHKKLIYCYYSAKIKNITNIFSTAIYMTGK